jgi:SH3 domain
MSGTKEQYLGILKAAYDYDAQDKGEVSIAEDQVLFLLDDSDPESAPFPPSRVPPLTVCSGGTRSN